MDKSQYNMISGSSHSILGSPEPGKHYQEEDMREPLFYPDPVLFRRSLEKLNRDDIEFKKNLTSHKATLRVLAPYLRIIHKDQRRVIDTVRSQRTQKQKEARLLFDKSRERFITTVPESSDIFEMVVSVHETADVLKCLLKANNVVSYIVNQTRNELYQSPRHVLSSTCKLTWKIQLGTTMAAYSAFTKTYVMSNNAYADQRFPIGLGYDSSYIKFALCVPIITLDGKVVAVYELTRDAFDTPFDKRDLQLVLAVTGWMGSAIYQNTQYISLLREEDLTNHLLKLTANYHCDFADIDMVLSDIVVFARETVGAERCSLYVLAKESKGSLIVEEYDQSTDTNKMITKRRLKKHVDQDDSILSKVMFNKETVSLEFPLGDGTLEGEFTLRSLLCLPIISDKVVIGAIQFMNKRTETKFTKEDEETLKKFATFCSINLNHLKLNDKIRKSQLQKNVSQEMLLYHMKPCNHDRESMKKRTETLPDRFFTFAWYPTPDNMPKLAEMTVNMFHEVLGDHFMSHNDVPTFVLTVQNCYRENCYHNFLHAFCVAHTMGNLIQRYRAVFTGIEQKSLMIAALCHDLDHRGYTSSFILLTKHYLADLYKTSPLENHHFAVTRIILHVCNMFNYMPPNIYDQMLTEIYENIVATDMSNYFQCRSELVKAIKERVFSFGNPDHRRLVKGLMMTACNLSGLAKPWPTCKKIADDLVEELYKQGDYERQVGFSPLPPMDRTKPDQLADHQVQFLSVVVIPCMETLSAIFSGFQPVVMEAKYILQHWKEMIEVKDQDTWKPEESIRTNPV